MREAIIILAVMAALLALTAIKYRRQIVALIGFYKQVQAIRSGLRDGTRRATAKKPLEGIQLVRCERCGKWISEGESTKIGGQNVCIDSCETTARA